MAWPMSKELARPRIFAVPGMNWAMPSAPTGLTALGSKRLSFQISRAKKSLGKPFRSACAWIRSQTRPISLCFAGCGGSAAVGGVRDGVDRYLFGHMDACKRLGGEWMVVHAGYHFTSDVEMRREAARERLSRMSGYAEKIGLTLLLENMNWEPDDAEVHYLVYNLEECKTFFSAVQSPAIGMSFTVNHAHLVPEGIDGHLDWIDFKRLGEVRRTQFARMESAVLGLEGLAARLAEVLALRLTSDAGEITASRIAELTGDLDGLRVGLAETAELSRTLLAQTADSGGYGVVR